MALHPVPLHDLSEMDSPTPLPRHVNQACPKQRYRSSRYLGQLQAHFTGYSARSSLHNGNRSVFDCARIHQVTLHLNEVLTIGRLQDKWLGSSVSRPNLSADVYSEWAFDDPTISAVHLRIYSVKWDEDGRFDPLVFAEDLSSNGTFCNGRYMGRGQQAVLLCDGDELKLSERVTLKFECKPNVDMSDMSTGDQLREIGTFSTYTVTTKTVGVGSFGMVVLALKIATKKQVACKIVNVAKFRTEELRKLNNETRDASETEAEQRDRIDRARQQIATAIEKKYREADILVDLCHPNVVGVEKIYHTGGAIYMMQELLTGGDLFSYCIQMSESRILPEFMTGFIVKQVLEAVAYLHDCGIVHRDIKLENILLSSRSDTPRVVLSDFGVAKRLLPTSKSPIVRMTTLQGTYGYMAPEILAGAGRKEEQPYTKSVDLWSVGCVTYNLLAGCSPFECDEVTTVADRNRHHMALQAPQQTIWTKAERQGARISSRAQDFIRNLLVVDASQRMTAKQSLAHHWFQNKHNKAAFDTAYESAIQGWRPHSQARDVIEKIVLPKGIDHRGKYLPKFIFSHRHPSRVDAPNARDPSRKPQLFSGTVRKIYRTTSNADKAVISPEAMTFKRRWSYISTSDVPLPPALNAIDSARGKRVGSRRSSLSSASKTQQEMSGTKATPKAASVDNAAVRSRVSNPALLRRPSKTRDRDDSKQRGDDDERDIFDLDVSGEHNLSMPTSPAVELGDDDATRQSRPLRMGPRIEVDALLKMGTGHTRKRRMLGEKDEQ